MSESKWVKSTSGSGYTKHLVAGKVRFVEGEVQLRNAWNSTVTPAKYAEDAKKVIEELDAKIVELRAQKAALQAEISNPEALVTPPTEEEIKAADADDGEVEETEDQEETDE